MESIDQILNSKESKMNFMKGLINIIKADGVIHELEKKVFQQFSKDIGLDDDNIKIINELLLSNSNEIDMNFENITQKMFFLKESLQMCYADGIYQDEEKDVIKEMGIVLNISQETISEMEEWTLEGIKWYQKGMKIFGLNENILR